MGRGAVVQGGEQGMWCPLWGCLGLLLALPSPSQGCVGLTGVGRWGASAVPLEVRGSSPWKHGRRMMCLVWGAERGSNGQLIPLLHRCDPYMDRAQIWLPL